MVEPTFTAIGEVPALMPTDDVGERPESIEGPMLLPTDAPDRYGMTVQMDAAREVMQRCRVALNELAR